MSNRLEDLSDKELADRAARLAADQAGLEEALDRLLTTDELEPADLSDADAVLEYVSGTGLDNEQVNRVRGLLAKTARQLGAVRAAQASRARRKATLDAASAVLAEEKVLEAAAAAMDRVIQKSGRHDYFSPADGARIRKQIDQARRVAGSLS